MRKIICFTLIFAMIFGFAFAKEKSPSIVCTSFPCFDFARAVCGTEENIKLLIKPGSEVHSYDPSPSDIMAIAQCDLFICIGGESDEWVEDILDSFGGDAPETIRLFECVEALEEETVEGMTVTREAEEHEIEYDEHIWTSPVNALKMLRTIEEKLGEIDPVHASEYSENADSYAEEISGIDASIRSLIDGAARKEMIFADRFPFLYFAREYGIDYYAAFPSCSAESEPSAKTMAFLIEKVLEDRIPVIYTIELSSQKTAKTIAEETGAEILTFHSVQTVSEDDFTNGETYVSLMSRNVEALQRGLC